MKWRRERVPLEDQTIRHRAGTLFGAFFDIASWGYLALLAVVSVSRLSDGSVPVLLQPLQAGYPLLGAPVWLVLVISGVTRRWFQAPVALVLAVTLIASVAPARRSVAEPYWVRDSARVRVASANVFFKNPNPDAAAEAVMARDADVMVVTEFTESFSAAFDRVGARERYPYRTIRARLDRNGVVVFSKISFVETEVLTDTKMPAVKLSLPSGEVLWVAAVHPYPPSTESQTKQWIRSLHDVRRFALGGAGDDPLALVGDFNGTRWQPTFGKLLAGSMIDAHEALGRGLSRSWPADRWLPPLVRLDHALLNERAFPVAIDDFVVPGSDHLAFEVTIAVKARLAPGVSPGEDSIVTTTTALSTNR